MQEILKNAQAALALFSSVLAFGGLLLCAAGYAAVFLSISQLDNAISPQIDAASAAIGDTQALLSSAEQSASSASQGLSEVSSALSAYSESTKGMGDSLAGVASVPPFSLDSRLSAAAAKLQDASALFANASQSLNSSAISVLNATQSLKKTADDLGEAKKSLGQAKEGFKGSVGMLHIASLSAALALSALFSSVLLLSVSMLLPHYPRFFKKKDGGDGDSFS